MEDPEQPEEEAKAEGSEESSGLRAVGIQNLFAELLRGEHKHDENEDGSPSPNPDSDT